MATNIEIKAAIDTDITNKILPNSVTNINVGARVKDVVDYVVQEVLTVNNNVSLNMLLNIPLSKISVVFLNLKNIIPWLYVFWDTNKIVFIESINIRVNVCVTSLFKESYILYVSVSTASVIAKQILPILT